MRKEEIRIAVSVWLKNQQKDKKRSKDQKLFQLLVHHPIYQHAKTIATYLSLPHEFDTRLFIRQAQADGKRIVIPKTYPHGRMVFVDYNPNDLQLTSFGIWEPKSGQVVEKTHIDLIHVPGVAFNKGGYRIGYGGGYYDRYLEDFKGMTVSTVYPCQLADFQPDNYDIPVQEVLICE